ncbi:rod shape-determining MreB domain protein [Anaplasma phagocytophilum str. ApNYW]|nr:rod shape-determining MreB domain protein [Anaplasma phagocytophilum str. ApNYW]
MLKALWNSRYHNYGHKLALECSPPEISADIVDQVIALTGGASMLKNL